MRRFPLFTMCAAICVIGFFTTRLVTGQHVVGQETTTLPAVEAPVESTLQAQLADEPMRVRLTAVADARGQSLEEFLAWLEGALDELNGGGNDDSTPPGPPQGDLEIVIQPQKQDVGKPVAVTISGLPSEEHYAQFSWTPQYPEDFRLDLYDRDGDPVTIFWSEKPGTRTVQMVTAVNGPTTPVVNFAVKTFSYGPDLFNPGPGPEITPPPAPTDAVLRAVVIPLATMFEEDPMSGLSIAGLYMAIADATRRDTNIARTSDLRRFLSLAEDDAYMSTTFVGKFPGFGKVVNEGYASYVGLDDTPLDAGLRSKSAAFFEAVAWACFPQAED